MHENILDESLLSLDAEERMIRGALHRAVESGRTDQATKLIQAQQVLRATALRLESFEVIDKRLLYQWFDDIVEWTARQCKKRGYKYAKKSTQGKIRSAIDTARNEPNDAVRKNDRRLQS